MVASNRHLNENRWFAWTQDPRVTSSRATRLRWVLARFMRSRVATPTPTVAKRASTHGWRHVGQRLLAATMWALATIAVVDVLTIQLKVSGVAGLIAILQDALPYLLISAWLPLIYGLCTRRGALAAVAALLVLAQLLILVPLLRTKSPPRWARTAPTIKIVVANVYIDNPDPGATARQLLATEATLLIVSEWNAQLVAAFDAAGGRSMYPHRLFDPNDHSDYAVGVMSKVPFARSEMLSFGGLTAATVDVLCGATKLTVVGMNPTAAVDPGGFMLWKTQMDIVAANVSKIRNPTDPRWGPQHDPLASRFPTVTRPRTHRRSRCPR